MAENLPDEVAPLAMSHCQKNAATWTMVALQLYCGITSFAFLVGVALGGVSPRVQVADADDIWHARTAILLIFSALVTELCVSAANSTNHQLLRDQTIEEEEVKLPGSDDSWLTLAEYGTKLLTGLYLWLFSGGIVHSDTLAVGGPRPVYAARFAQWSVAVPILVLITNKAFIETWNIALRRSVPSLMAAFLYVWASWLMEVTASHVVRWPMMILSMVGAVLLSLDQIHLARQYREAPLFGIKSGMLAYQLLSFVLYAAVFVCGRFGVLPSRSEQFFYAYSDATVKVLHGAILAMIRNREGAAEIHRWWLASIAIHKDVQQLLEKAQVPIFSVDLNGKIIQWNNSISKLTGLESDEVLGKLMVDIVSADNKGDIQAQLQACVTPSAQADATLVEVVIPTRKASKGNLPDLRMLAMTFVPKNNRSGMIEGVTAIGQDLSDLANMKVVQERKNSLMAMVSHELRSPLHGMLGLTDAMLSMPTSTPLKRQLGMVRGCAARLLDLVTNVMDLAQTEKMQSEGEQQPLPNALVDFGAIVDEACTMIGNSVDKTNKPLLKSTVRLENTLAGSKVPLIRGDHYKCTQMVYNLLTNACKFTQKGEISVAARHVPEKKLLEIDISDTGRGISEDGQKRIFLPFQQENEGDTRSFQGIGLGLSVCKGIAELHQGTLHVKSKLGHGSTFTLSLPCDGDLGEGVWIEAEHRECGQNGEKHQVLDAESSQLPPAMPGADANNSSFEGMPLILSVDDDEVNQEVVKSSLSHFCDVQVAMDGPQALEILRKLAENDRCPDLVLLDIQMPGMTGFEVCETIRTQFAYKPSKLPVTMVSAKTPEQGAALKAFDCGSTDYISKPFNREILQCKVKAALNMKASVGPSGSAGIVAKEALERIHCKERETASAVAKANQLEKLRDQLQEQLAAKVNMIEELKQNMQQMKQKQEEQEQQAQQALDARHATENDFAKAKAKQLEKLRDQLQEQLVAKVDMIEELRQNLQQTKQKLEEQEQKTQQTLDAQLATDNDFRGDVPWKPLRKDARTPSLDDILAAPPRRQCTQIIKQPTCNMESAKTAIDLLISRLRLCSSNSKQCCELLQVILDRSLPLDAAGLMDVDNKADVNSSELPYHGLTLMEWLHEFMKVVKIVAAELQVLERSGSSLSGIETLIEDLSLSMECTDYDCSNEEALVLQSTIIDSSLDATGSSPAGSTRSTLFPVPPSTPPPKGYRKSFRWLRH